MSASPRSLTARVRWRVPGDQLRRLGGRSRQKSAGENSAEHAKTSDHLARTLANAGAGRRWLRLNAEEALADEAADEDETALVVQVPREAPPR